MSRKTFDECGGRPCSSLTTILVTLIEKSKGIWRMSRSAVVVTAILGLLLFTTDSTAVDSSYPVTRINATTLTIDTKVYTIETSEGTLDFNYKSPRTGALTGDKFTFKIFDVQTQRFRFKPRWNDTYCNDISTPSEPLLNWTTIYEPGPSGTLNLTSIGRFSGSCEFIASFLFTNAPVNITFGNNTIEIQPHRAKLTINVRCPWKRALDFFNQSYPDSAQIMGRTVAFDVLMRFTHSTPLTGNLLLLNPILNGRVSWASWTDLFCRDVLFPENSPMVPVHRDQSILDYIFDFGVVTELLEWKVSLLSYGVTDNFNVSSVEVAFDLLKGTNPETVSLAGSMRFELSDCTSSMLSSVSLRVVDLLSAARFSHRV
eukprot:TRINITY_DN1653_c0_g1_i3.p1 TRINITY_DN1653_c0_g1~~TRINITY_DN1653_c0_g1_i3.p1  ORF type:complete len:372 (-),score=35.32 TRINITY_DN1653_c0_g1_i3:659-1774(-)